MKVRTIGVVLWKELLDGLRDRRSLTAALLTSLLGPLVIGFALLSQVDAEAESKPLALTVIGAERAPALMSFLAGQRAQVSPAPVDLEPQIRAGRLAVALRIAPDYREDFRNARSAGVEVLYDSSRRSGRAAAARARRLLDGYGRDVATLRLVARGLSPEVARPLDLDEVDLATPKAKAAVMTFMLPMFLLMAAFVASMNLAIDATAGERERRSLEALLLQPVQPWAVAAGKWLAGVAASVIGVVLTLLVSQRVLGWERLQDLGFPVALGTPELLACLAVLLPVAVLAPALQMLVALFSHNFKEAQTYLSLLLFLPMVPGFVVSFSASEPPAWAHWVPLVGQQLVLTEALQGKLAPGVALGLGVATVAVALAAVALTGRLLRHERIVFGR